MTPPAPRTALEYWERSRCPACGQIVFGAEPPEAAQGSGSLDVLRDALVRIGSDPSVPIPVRRQAKEAVRAALAAGSSDEAGSRKAEPDGMTGPALGVDDPDHRAAAESEAGS